MRQIKPIPDWAVYLGTSDPDGYIFEQLADRIDAATDPAFFVEDDGSKSFFDLAREIVQ